MPNVHDENMHDILQEAAPPSDARVPDSAEEVALEAEIVELPADADGEELDAELVEAEVEGDEQHDAESRPSVHGRLAKPHKPKHAAEGKKAQRKERRPGFARRVVLGVIVSVLALLLVGTGLFCWQKWMRFDDSLDIQGVWKVQATGDTIVFDGRELKLTKGIAYEYRLDTSDKAIAYNFGEFEGGGHYYFSADRQMLIIIDGDERLGALAEVGFLPGELVENDDATDNKTVLAKVSNDTSAEPSGTATGVATGRTTGEREYLVKPEPSSSDKKKSKSTKSEDDEDAEHRGFVDEDGDGYDDETGLEYEDFLASRAEAAFIDEDEDGYDDVTGLEYDEFLAEYGVDSEDGESADDESYDEEDEDAWVDDGEDDE